MSPMSLKKRAQPAGWGVEGCESGEIDLCQRICGTRMNAQKLQDEDREEEDESRKHWTVSCTSRSVAEGDKSKM